VSGVPPASKKVDRVPAESVGVLADEITDPERGRDAVRRLLLATGIVAAVAWLATLGVARFSSETNGIYASWFAIFPTTFALGGHLALRRGMSGGRALAVAFVAGAAGCLSLWVFFEGIWPSL
jgi:hypothetical protein